MKKTKRLAALLLCTLMVCALMPVMSVGAATTPDGILEYEILDDHVVITGCSVQTEVEEGEYVDWEEAKSGEPVYIVIPSKIDGKPVTEISPYAFAFTTTVKSITIPATVTEIETEMFDTCYGLETINIEEGHPSLKSVDGVLFDKDMTKLLIYPKDSKRTEYTVPEGVREIATYAFDDNRVLETLNLPASFTEAFYQSFISRSIANINVAEGNPYLTSVDGILFNKNMTELVYFGSGRTQKEYTIPGTVTKLGLYSINSFDLEKLYMPKSVTVLDLGALKSAYYLTEIYYAGSEANWAAVEIENYNNALDKATIHCNAVFDAATVPKTAGKTDEVAVIVNGSAINFDVPPIIIEGTTMLPVRYALEPMGAEFEWNGEAQTVTINANGKIIVLTIGSTTALVNGEAKTMLQPAMKIEGRTLIPIRFVAEEVGYHVDWDGETRTVLIY